MGFQEKLIEGSYNYYQENKVYCEEHFKVFREEGPRGNFTFQAELLSRVETGEFLKIYVDYSLSRSFEPLKVKIKRSLGEMKSSEIFLINATDKTMRYTFTGADGTKETTKALPGKHHIVTPAFSTSMLMTEAKKIDPVHRTLYNGFSSDNIWSWEGPPRESALYLEMVNSEPVSLKIKNQELQASHYQMFEADKIQAPEAKGHPIFVSKYYQIPYLAEFPNGIRVEIAQLKNFENHYARLFKG